MSLGLAGVLNNGTRMGRLESPRFHSDNGTSFFHFDNEHWIPLSAPVRASAGLSSISIGVWFRTSYNSAGGNWNENWALFDFDRSEYFSVGCAADGSLFFSTKLNRHHDDMFTSETSFADGDWHYVVASFDSPSGTKTIYCDGMVKTASTVEAYVGEHFGASSPVRYGFLGDGSEASTEDGDRNEKHFEGDIGLVHAYTIALSLCDVLLNYDTTRTPYSPGNTSLCAPPPPSPPLSPLPPPPPPSPPLSPPSPPALELCYRVSYNLSNTLVEHLLKPVSRFPSSHPKLALGVCPPASNASDFIPAISEYASDHDSPEECVTVPGAEAFYAYDYPVEHSANTGNERADTMLLYFTVDDAKNVSFVLVNDVPDSDGGDVHAHIHVEPASAGRDLQLIVADDPTNMQWGRPDNWDQCDPASTSRDCYAYDSAQGRGSMKWSWAACCTDGMVIGPLPYEEFCFDLQVLRHDGITRLELGSYAEADNTIETIEVPIEALAYGAIRVCAFTCEDFCAEYNTCGECTSSSEGACG
eukprot:gene13020-15382_t